MNKVNLVLNYLRTLFCIYSVFFNQAFSLVDISAGYHLYSAPLTFGSGVYGYAATSMIIGNTEYIYTCHNRAENRWVYKDNIYLTKFTNNQFVYSKSVLNPDDAIFWADGIAKGGTGA